MDGNFVSGLEGAEDEVRVLKDLTTNHEQSCLLTNAVKVVIQLWRKLGRTIIISDTPLTLGALNNIIRSSAKGEGPIAVRVSAARLLRAS